MVVEITLKSMLQCLRSPQKKKKNSFRHRPRLMRDLLG